MALLESGPAAGNASELVLLVEHDTEDTCHWRLEAEVRRALWAGARLVCLDLGELRHCDDALLASLVRCQRMVRAAGGRLIVVAQAATVRLALVTVGLDRHLRTGPLCSAEVDW